MPPGSDRQWSAAEVLLHSFPTSLGLAPRAVRLAKRGVTRVNYAFLASEIDENDPSLHCAARLADSWGVDLRVFAFSPSGLADQSFHDKFDFTSELIDEWREHSLAVMDRSHDVLGEFFPDLSGDSDIGSGKAGRVRSMHSRGRRVICSSSAPPHPARGNEFSSVSPPPNSSGTSTSPFC